MPYKKGFGAILVVVVLALILLGGALFFLKTSNNQPNLQSVPNLDQNADEPPLKLKSIGVNFDYYDPKTGRAGDFKFTKQKLQFNRLFMGFGFVIPVNVSASGKPKANPQPTFILPLGTPVRSLVDGVVANTPMVWSGDYSIQVTKSGKLEKWIYETEHVMNPKVKVGDKVSAGQIIAEVSNFDKGVPEGFGAVEIGILKGGGEGPPQHVCPFAYLDESIKEDTEKKIRAFFKAWEEYKGDTFLYDESLLTPGCLTLDPIEG
ncbi:MAG: M23 family metallopeptidase [Candidatus Curtissbacteria bacterium]